MLRGLLLVAAWVAACVLLVLVELEAPGFLLGELSIGVVAGAVINRWWAPLAPAAVAGLLLLGTLIVDPGCGYCGDDSFGEYARAVLFAAVVPSAFGALTGVALRRLLDRLIGAR